jgi:ATP-dependent Clp protease ATP-binding subunit ClpA
MLEAMGAEARRVLVLAEEEATALGSHVVGSEHILLALLHSDGPAGELLAARGITRDVVVAAGSAGGTLRASFDPMALATLGIDVDEVRRRVEETFGRGALERTRAGRRLCTERPFAPAAKKALELAVNEARCEPVEAEHLLLGLVLERKSRAAALLRERGISADLVREALSGRRAA